MGELHADLPLAAFAHIQDSFGSRTGAAQTCLKALRAAYTWGKEQGYKGGEAVFDVRNTHRQKGGATPWTADDEQKFLDAHGPGTMARCWFLLAKNIAGRIGEATGGESGEMSRELTLTIYARLGWTALGIGLAVIALAPLVRRWMHLDTLRDEAAAGEGRAPR